MASREIIKEIELLEAMADTMKEKCYTLREKLGVVSTSSTTLKSKKRAAVIAESVAKMRSRYIK